MPDTTPFVVIVVAAGRGTRAGGGAPKQYRRLAGRPLLAWTLEAVATPDAELIVPVIHRDDLALFNEVAASLSRDAARRLAAPVIGGETRQDSVRAGLASLSARPPELVLVHDGARPFPSAAMIARVAAAAAAGGAAVPALAILDTVKQIDAEGGIVGTLDRQTLTTVQTPQAFKYSLLNEVHNAALQQQRYGFTDDASLLEWAGRRVETTVGDRRNMKVTEPDDFTRAEATLRASLSDVRVGQGYDVHAFCPGDHLWLGGVKIAHDKSLSGHSDADVGLHALTDAVLGALGDGDIGQHFPPSDARWRGASSDQFLRDAVARVARRGGIIAHLDLTIVCEAPKIGPHREAMRERIAAIAGIEVDRVGVKATTSERMGFTGREEGIAATACATVRLPERGNEL